MAKKVQCIYRITCKWNDMVYIGQTTNLRMRMFAHWSRLRRGEHPGIEMQADFKLYGRRAFEYEVLETIDDPDELREREKHWIREYFPNVYNSQVMEYRPPKPDIKRLKKSVLRVSKQALEEARQDG